MSFSDPPDTPDSIAVVLTPSGSVVPESVTADLAGLGCRVIVQHDPAMAMADLCIQTRSAVARTAWGLQSAGRIRLVVVDAAAWPHLNDLSRAVRRYLPDVHLHEEGETLEAEPPMPVMAPASPAVEPPRNTLPQRESGRDEPSDEPTRVTAGEIEMLLGDPPGDD